MIVWVVALSSSEKFKELNLNNFCHISRILVAFNTFLVEWSLDSAKLSVTFTQLVFSI